jgi:hypothetical protein
VADPIGVKDDVAAEIATETLPIKIKEIAMAKNQIAAKTAKDLGHEAN